MLASAARRQEQNKRRGGQEDDKKRRARKGQEEAKSRTRGGQEEDDREEDKRTSAARGQFRGVFKAGTRSQALQNPLLAWLTGRAWSVPKHEFLSALARLRENTVLQIVLPARSRAHL